jgi:hypothetical protein
VLEYMTSRVAKRWLPQELPLTSTGEIDKKVLRGRYKGHRLIRMVTRWAAAPLAGRAGGIRF